MKNAFKLPIAIVISLLLGGAPTAQADMFGYEWGGNMNEFAETVCQFDLDAMHYNTWGVRGVAMQYNVDPNELENLVNSPESFDAFCMSMGQTERYRNQTEIDEIQAIIDYAESILKRVNYELLGRGSQDEYNDAIDKYLVQATVALRQDRYSFARANAENAKTIATELWRDQNCFLRYWCGN